MSDTEKHTSDKGTTMTGLVDFLKEFYVVLLFGTFFLLNMFLPLLFLPEGNIRWVYGLFSGIVTFILVILLVAFVRKREAGH